MNRLKSSGSCRICGTWLEGRWAEAPTVAERAELARQIENGMCDACQRARQSAAIEYERACSDARLFGAMGANLSRNRQTHPVMRQAMGRIEAANARCVALKMWPPVRAA